MWGSVAVLGALALGASPAVACEQPCKEATRACVRADCAGLEGATRRGCVRACRGRGGCARIRTLAYVVSTCRSDGKGIGLFAGQELFVRRRNCAPVSVRAVTLEGPFAFTFPLPGFEDLCGVFGVRRAAGNSRLAGVFQRLGVSRDGSLVAFEVSDDRAPFAPTDLPDDAEGLFVVRADGTGLRRLGAESRAPVTAFFITDAGEISANHGGATLEFSPDRRTLVLLDLGAGPSGEEATQIVTVDVATGRRQQLTRLPPTTPTDRGELAASRARFVGNRRVAFLSYANPEGLNPSGEPRIFTVRTDGTGLRTLRAPRALGGTVVPEFAITGGLGSVMTMQLPGGDPPENENLEHFPSKVITEVFLVDGRQVLQLTDFNRVDTLGRTLSGDGRTVFVRASGDPFRLNPSNDCQLFSVDRLGRRLRQLTRFHEADRSVNGCNTGPPPGCQVSSPWEDPVTRTLVFSSSCNPFGNNPYGDQVFALRPNGTALRQLTATRGYEEAADGSVSVELAGPAGYSAVY